MLQTLKFHRIKISKIKIQWSIMQLRSTVKYQNTLPRATTYLWNSYHLGKVCLHIFFINVISTIKANSSRSLSRSYEAEAKLSVEH